MPQDELLRRIDRELARLRLSDRKACLLAAQRAPAGVRVGIDFIRDIRRRGHSPKADKLVVLAGVLGVAPEYLLLAADQEREDRPRQRQTILLTVRGEVQAGAYREAIEWPQNEWYSLSLHVPKNDRFPGVERFGLEVHGNSMNSLYPDGSIVMVVKFGDIGRPPISGERVVAVRRAETGNYEATLKEYKLDEKGRHVLWPRSDDPEFQTPIILTGNLPVSDFYEPLPDSAFAGQFPHAAGEPDVSVVALVVGSYRDE